MLVESDARVTTPPRHHGTATTSPTERDEFANLAVFVGARYVDDGCHGTHMARLRARAANLRIAARSPIGLQRVSAADPAVHLQWRTSLR